MNYFGEGKSYCLPLKCSCTLFSFEQHNSRYFFNFQVDKKTLYLIKIKVVIYRYFSLYKIYFHKRTILVSVLEPSQSRINAFFICCKDRKLWLGSVSKQRKS